MKVKLASQVISQSVANALLTMSELKYPNFQNVQPTVDYLQCFDSIFDLMNSRCKESQFLKGNVHQKDNIYIYMSN